MQVNSDADIWRPWSSKNNMTNKNKIIQLIDYSSTSSSDDDDNGSSNEVAVESSADATPGGDVLLQEPRVSSSRTTKSESPRQQVSRYLLQGSAKRNAEFVKQQPGRVMQKS